MACTHNMRRNGVSEYASITSTTGKFLLYDARSTFKLASQAGSAFLMPCSFMREKARHKLFLSRAESIRGNDSNTNVRAKSYGISSEGISERPSRF